jgi:16S rRNA (uracil1498-N3)-methyltransferase
LTIPRIYSTEILESKKSIQLPEDNLKYLKAVMRLKPGGKIIVFDGYGSEFEAIIEDFSVNGIGVKLGKQIPRENKKIKISLAQALPKATKMDLIVKSAAELGVDLIIPFTAARSVSRIDTDRAAQKIKRWQKIAMEASRASRSGTITEVENIASLESAIKFADDRSAKMIFWEEEEKTAIKNALTDKSLDACKNYFIIVGPEGGFSKDEITMAKKAGFKSVGLGRQILKVETAAAAIISIIQYEKGIFSHKS